MNQAAYDRKIRAATFPHDFIHEALGDVADAWHRAGGVARHFTFGPLRVELRTFAPAPLDHLLGAITHACVNSPADDPVIIYGLDAAATGMAPPPETWPLGEVGGDRLPGAYWSAVAGLGAASDAERGIWSLYDAAGRSVLCWYRDAACLPEWEPAAPFRIGLHWAALSAGAQLVHGAAIGIGGRGVLVTGPGGSGKSTTTAAAIDHGLETSGEDFVLVEGIAPPVAHAVFDTLKLTGMALDSFPDLAGAAVNPRRPAEEKARVHLGDIAPDRFVASISMDGLATIRIGHGDRTTWRPVNAVKVLRALAPSTMFLLRTAMEEIFSNLGAMARGLPCYELELGSDPREVAGALERFIMEVRQ